MHFLVLRDHIAYGEYNRVIHSTSGMSDPVRWTKEMEPFLKRLIPREEEPIEED